LLEFCDLLAKEMICNNEDGAPSAAANAEHEPDEDDDSYVPPELVRRLVSYGKSASGKNPIKKNCIVCKANGQPNVRATTYCASGLSDLPEGKYEASSYVPAGT